MSISMFDTVKFVETDAAHRAGMIEIQVGGPLLLDKASKYKGPIAISFAIFQSAEGQHAFDKTKRARGVAIVDPITKKWKGDLLVKPDYFVNGEARVIAVAVIPKDDQFAYETLTWCESFTLDVRKSKTG